MTGRVSDTYEILPLDCTYPSGSFGAVHRFSDSMLIVSVCHYCTVYCLPVLQLQTRVLLNVPVLN
jgi:hypothetical protein